MNYELIKAQKIDLELLKRYKLDTIMEYADNLSEEEITRIKRYIDIKVLEQLDEYKLIKSENKIIGCLLIYNYEMVCF